MVVVVVPSHRRMVGNSKLKSQQVDGRFLRAQTAHCECFTFSLSFSLFLGVNINFNSHKKLAANEHQGRHISVKN